MISYLKFYLHAIQKCASLFQIHHTKNISKVCSFPNRIFEIRRRIYCALEVVVAPSLNLFFHFSFLLFWKNQASKRSATFIWAVGPPHRLESFICSSASVVLVYLSPATITDAAARRVSLFLHWSSFPVALSRAGSVMVQAVLFSPLQHHPRSQSVVTDLGRYSWREFNTQGEDTPIQSDTACTPRRRNSFLAGEYAESLQTLVSWAPVQDWETSSKTPKAILHIKRGFRVCLRNCESYIIVGFHQNFWYSGALIGKICIWNYWE